MLQITDAGKQYVQTHDFGVRLNDTVEWALKTFGPSQSAVDAGMMFTALCLAGLGRCGCATLCESEATKFQNEGGEQFMDEHKDEIWRAAIHACLAEGLGAHA